jgi:two-component system, NarL family, sensor kinase
MQNTSTEILTVILVATAIILLLIVLVVFFIVIYQRRVMGQKMKMQMIETDAHRQKMAAIVETQESERMRIARDLHDEVGALLSTVKMSLKLSQRKLAKEGVENNLDESASILDTAIASVREISHDLLPPSLETLGLAAALVQLAEKTATLTGIPFICKVTGEPSRLPIRTELTLYRVVQELISNSLKHSHATERGLEMVFAGERLRLFFRDNGIGFDLPAMKDSGRGIGLSGMESRVAALGGEMWMQSATGQGFSAEISLAFQTSNPSANHP